MGSNIFASLENAGRVYRQGELFIEALLSATCTVSARDRIAVVGPSGSGKSTLLHLLGGLDQATSGRVSWPALGDQANLRPEKIGFVFQVPSLLPSLTVVENIEVPLLLGGTDEAKARAISMDILERMELKTIAEKLPEELSGGQAQRVAVARTLVYQPKMILADEPTGHLDHPTAQHLFDVLLGALEGSDTALLVATHDLAIAGRMQKIWRMQHGVLEVEW